MKVLLIGNYQQDAIKSMDKFAFMLEIYLNKLGHEVRVIRPNAYFGKMNFSSGLIKKWLGYIDKLILFPSQLRQALSWAEIVHVCDQGNAVYIKYLKDKPHVVTCHDLLAIRSGLGEFPEYKTGLTAKKLQQMILKGLNQAQKVICVSEQTKNDVLRLSSLSENAVSLVPVGLNYSYTPMPVLEANQRLEALGVPQNCQFILHVGANHWYKNRLGVLEIFDQLTLKLKQQEFYLVMAGQPMTDEMRNFIQMHSNLTKKVIELVDVDNENLRALYSCATALLFPSLYEGFGWPIIEAQACGCPVFTSNRPPMNDVGGDAAIYIDPDNYEKAAEKIIEYIPILEEFKLKGFVNSQRFTVKTMMEQYIDLYEQCIINKPKLKV
ncbi:MAG: glycosyltransferase family 4 protein [Nostochopsis sp.]